MSLARDVDTEKAVDNPQPYERTMLAHRFRSLRRGLPRRGAHASRLARAHQLRRRVLQRLQAGRRCGHEGERHARNSIINVKNGIFTRGILIDIPRLKGVPYLEPGTPIYPEDSRRGRSRPASRCPPATRCSFAPGGGRGARSSAVGPRREPEAAWPRCVGHSVAEAARHRPPWKRRAAEPVAVGCRGPDGPGPRLCARTLGVHLFDNCDLEALAEAAAARKRWEFLLTVAPLPIRGGTGSPVNPIATF